MQSQKRKTPGKKETKQRAVQAKEAAEQKPLDPVLLAQYRQETTRTWQAIKAAYPLRFNSPQAWGEWKTAVVYQYEVYKKYQALFSPGPRTADEAKYSWDFRESIELLRGGDATQKEAAIAFLEADPWFHGSGYDKTVIIRALKPPMLKPSDIRRLQSVVLSLVDRRDDRDFHAFCRLAAKSDGPELRDGLTRRLNSTDADIRRRARWVLEALAQKDHMEKQT